MLSGKDYKKPEHKSLGGIKVELKTCQITPAIDLSFGFRTHLNSRKQLQPRDECFKISGGLKGSKFPPAGTLVERKRAEGTIKGGDL